MYINDFHFLTLCIMEYQQKSKLRVAAAPILGRAKSELSWECCRHIYDRLKCHEIPKTTCLLST